MKQLLSLFIFCMAFLMIRAQPVTGVWRGKFTNGSGMFASTGRAELKLVAKGDSLVGTCYYFSNANSYLRWSVKGYFDKEQNAVHWWDEELLGVKPVGKTKVNVYKNATMVSDADFNCPGNNVMKLDGKSQIGTDGPEFVLHFDKIEKPLFRDEWDNVIEGYFTGMADPGIIDSVYAITPPFKSDVPADVLAKIDDPNGSLKKQEKTNLPIEKPVVIASEKPSLEKQKPTDDTIAKAPPVVIAKVDPPAEKPIGTMVPDSKKTDTQVVAKKEPAAEKPVVVPPPVVAKTAPSTDNKTSTAKTDEPIVVNQTKPSVTNTATKPLIISPPPVINEAKVSVAKKPETQPAATVAKSTPIVIKPTVIPEKIDPIAVEKFVTRKKITQGQIPLVGDTIELNFYDNAEIDGDSISLFLNGKLMFNHVMLLAQAYTFKLAVKDIPDGSELTMVAENLGSIPPNTAYMMAVVDGVRYSARLESTEQSSGVIKLVRR